MKVKYVQMESEAFLTDMDFVTMSLWTVDQKPLRPDNYDMNIKC
jgi:hypothetical protein